MLGLEHFEGSRDELRPDHTADEGKFGQAVRGFKGWGGLPRPVGLREVWGRDFALSRAGVCRVRAQKSSDAPRVIFAPKNEGTPRPRPFLGVHYLLW
jgi:hypothetical protein